ncbi:hypothetical protein GCM10020229_60440 [Kitasatospora albolonga]|uniref:divalent cation tolerance protein CutA n=1 Tax=Kitasatospora albolonga TaxID=68173 RepID=UPI0031E947E6
MTWPRAAGTGADWRLRPRSTPSGRLYWWDGEVQDAEEWRIDLKTRAGLAADLREFITARHPYDTPETDRRPDHRRRAPPTWTGSPPEDPLSAPLARTQFRSSGSTLARTSQSQ